MSYRYIFVVASCLLLFLSFDVRANWVTNPEKSEAFDYFFNIFCDESYFATDVERCFNFHIASKIENYEDVEDFHKLFLNKCNLPLNVESGQKIDLVVRLLSKLRSEFSGVYQEDAFVSGPRKRGAVCFFDSKMDDFDQF